MIATQPPAITKRMIDAALKAAHIALLRRKQGLNVKTKSDGSKVTSGDYQAQQIIKAELEKLSPALEELLAVDRVGFIMEENITDQPQDCFTAAPRANWVVDPIDGTIGYSRKLGEKPAHWAVSIALVKDGKTIAAAVYEAGPHEYGTTKADFDAIDPTHPHGKIFWADADVKNAYRIEGKDGELRVTPVNAKENYAQRTAMLRDGHELPILVAIPELRAHIGSAATVTRLDASTKVRPAAKPLLDTYNNAEFAARCGWKESDYEHCLSAVAGAMRAADGRASAFIATKCREWDRAAAALILEKSRAPFSEHRRSEGNQEAA